MPKQTIFVPEIGNIIVSKRKGAKNLRLSISSNGQVRLSMPYWAPYGAGVAFINSKKTWLIKQLQLHKPAQITNGSRFGKSHQLLFYNEPSKNPVVDLKVTSTVVEARTQLDLQDTQVQSKVLEACEKALRIEAKQLLPLRVSALSKKHNLNFRSLGIKKLTSRWGSCSSQNDISLSFFLIQLPWELIDYVIVHELTHTKFLNHGTDFWNFMTEKMPNVKELRKQIRTHRPRIEFY